MAGLFSIGAGGLAWAPFVGIFIARISRGRTIREFVLGVTIVPTLFIVLWMGVFGGSAIDLISNQGFTELGDAVQGDQAVALFRFLDYLPGTRFLSLVCLLMIVVFFVTSADSGAMVLNMLSAGGEDNTPRYPAYLMDRCHCCDFVGIAARRRIECHANRSHCQCPAVFFCHAGCAVGFLARARYR